MIEQIYLIFRFCSVFLALLIGFFCYEIYKLTRKGSVAWKYIAILGVGGSLWALTQLISNLFSFEVGLVFSQIIYAPLLGLFPLLASVQLVIDMGIKKPKFFTIRNSLIYFFTLFLFLIIYNLLTSYENFLLELANICIAAIPICFLPANFNFYKIWRGTKTNTWLIIFLGLLMFFMGEFFVSYTGTCCEHNLSPLCSQDPLNFPSIYPLPCILFILPIAIRGELFLLIGEIFWVTGFFKLWKSMK